MAAEWKVGNHLLIGKFIPLRALNHTVQNQDIPICFTEMLKQTKDVYNDNTVTWLSDLVSVPSKGLR